MAEEVVTDKNGLVYPCGVAPAVGDAKELAPGVWWLRMPMPFALDHINLWALRDGDGWALVDTGIWSTDTAGAWRQLFAGVLDGPVTRVFVTHMHPDHIGMAGWLTRKFACRLWISRLEYLSCRALSVDTGREAPDDAIAFCRRAGWGEDALPGDHVEARQGGLGDGRHVGDGGGAFRPGHRQGAQPSAADVLDRGGQGYEQRFHMPRDQVDHGRPAAAIGNMDEAQIRLLREQRTGQVADRPIPLGGNGQPAFLFLRPVDEARDIRYR